MNRRAWIVAVALAWLATPGAAHASGACAHFGRPAIASDPRPHALRVFAIQFRQAPATMTSPNSFKQAIDCAMRTEVVPHLARGRPNLVVFDEDIGLETLAAGSRGAKARALLRSGAPSCRGRASPCATLATLSAIDDGYGRALTYLGDRFPKLNEQLGRAFVAATDQFVRMFMTTMATEALRYRVYVVASNTQAPFRLTRNPAAVAALSDPADKHVRAVYTPTQARAYDQTFIWGPQVVHHRVTPPLANLLRVNRKVPLTGFELALGFAQGPPTGPTAAANLRPVAIPGTGARLGFATSLPAFEYGEPGDGCANVAVSYMRCLDKLGANVVIQADANDGEWSGTDGMELWQPLSWMGSAYRAVTDPSVHFTYAVNPFMVGNLADTPFDGQSAILERGRRGAGCHYVGNRAAVPGDDLPQFAPHAGPKPQFLALAPWVVPDGPRPALRRVGASLAAGTGPRRYVQTAVIADLPFPVDRNRPGCLVAGR
ncbi:MAG TPA: hypothetical protein VFI54_28280 [Solirubrobacteraceae bacterium]|nr:hypothetical protein [Solirubrobacteraceae bacterium]